VSFDALAWAAKQATGSSGTKLVLLGLAECADRSHSLAFPSIAALVEFTSLDRKSVISNLSKLEAAGYITDTGRKVGRTGQIKVYQINVPTVPETEPSQKRNRSGNSGKSTGNGTRNLSEPDQEAKASFTEVAARIEAKWNETAKRCGFKECRVLDNSRKQTLRLRLKEHGEARLLEAIDMAAKSAWLRGEGRDSKWRPGLDFILQPASLRKILEDSYGSDEPAPRRISKDEEREANLRTAALYDRMGRTDEAEEIRRHWSPAQQVGALAQKFLEGSTPQ
jgi:hypothetical protein